MSNAVELVAVVGPNAGKRYAVSAQGAILGRSRTADICLDDSALSRQHCRIFFNPTPQIEDLGSSNGTLVNGIAVVGGSTALMPGDTIALGDTVFRVEFQSVTTPPQAQATTQEATIKTQPASVQPPSEEQLPLFSMDSPQTTDAPAESKQPNLFENTEIDSATEETKPGWKRLLLPLVAVVTLCVGGAAVFIMTEDTSAEQSQASVRRLAQPPAVAEFSYERLSVDARHLFRYRLSYDAALNLMLLDVTDLGDTDRSFTKRMELPEEAKRVLVKILMEAELETIGEIFPERSIDGISFERRKLTVVRGREVWARVAENVTHTAFNALCEQLEFFAKNELKVWAAQYSVDELETLGAKQLEIANRYWEQRDLGDEKLWAAIVAYKQGLSALETLNPKPTIVNDLNSGLAEAETLLTTRYEEALFQVEQALNTQRYEVAVQQLQKILRMIPDRDDARYRQASERLLTVEQRRGLKGVR